MLLFFVEVLRERIIEMTIYEAIKRYQIRESEERKYQEKKVSRKEMRGAKQT